jgi:predicted Zn-dependent protease
MGLTIGKLVEAGRALEKSAEIRAALEKCRAALFLDPTDAVLRLDYGRSLCRLGQWQQGAVELEEVLCLDSSNAAAAKALHISLNEIKSVTKQATKGTPQERARRANAISRVPQFGASLTIAPIRR